MELKLIPEEEKYSAGTDVSQGYNEAGSPSLGKTVNLIELLWEGTTSAEVKCWLAPSELQVHRQPPESSMNKQEGAIFSLLAKLPIFL